MTITPKIIITDTNIITDLDNAKLLEKFVGLDNVYINDMVKNDEINFKTGDVNIINKMNVLPLTAEQLQEVNKLYSKEKVLSQYDLINYVVARDNNCILATGDNRLKKYSEEHGVEVIRTLKIIELMKNKKIITETEAVTACINLRENKYTRIPEMNINELINKLQIVTS